MNDADVCPETLSQFPAGDVRENASGTEKIQRDQTGRLFSIHPGGRRIEAVAPALRDRRIREGGNGPVMP
ncbi:hypothetical protein [Paracoccus sp. (in: a-proteobacteria)]|uniref:hypothetical protein n=1 Tax=Paracoccus sp. TaxID=267 RepID=UPI0035B272AE